MGIFTKGISKYAYQGELTCPFGNCRSKALRYLEDVTPFRQRYRCRKCGMTFQYDISGRRDLNPYAPYMKNAGFRQGMNNLLHGRKLKGELQ